MRGIAESLDERALRSLLAELGREAGELRFDVAPNPCVGAALLAGSREVARGYHRAWGETHAEVGCLEAARASNVPPSAWTTLVVTLEPCSSHGKTPSCVDTIVESGVGHVVVGARDPDPRHQGRGLEELRAAGIEVTLLEGSVPLDQVAPHFLRWQEHERRRRPRPWTIAKWAQTLSGQLSPPEDVGGGRWISSPESLVEVQVLRARVDAIVTGVGTVVSDDPRFTLRGSRAGRAPLRVVLDGYLRTPPTSKLLRASTELEPGEAAGDVHVLCLAGYDAARARALEAEGARVHGLHGTDRHRLDLRDVQSWLWDQGLQRVLIEAGPRLLGSYLDSGFVDQLRVVTGAVRGGRGESLGTRLAAARLLERRDRECGQDSVLEGFLAPE